MNAHNVIPKMKYDINTFVNKVRVHEGLVLTVYKDTLGIDTIGIGRNLQDRGNTASQKRMRITSPLTTLQS